MSELEGKVWARIGVLVGMLASLGCKGAQQCVEYRPVLFVHGSGLDSRTWEPMRRAFEAAGYPATWLRAVDMEPADGSSIAAAQNFIAPAVDQLLTEAQREAHAKGCTAPSKVDVVAHSMGSIAARWYVSRIDASRVRNVVGIAPANHGSDRLCGLPGAGNRELCPAFGQDDEVNEVQTGLNGTTLSPLDETPFGVGSDRAGVPSIAPDAGRSIRYTTYRLASDEWIEPSESAVLDGAGGLRVQRLDGHASITSPGNILWLAAVPHDELPADAALIASVLNSLRLDVEP